MIRKKHQTKEEELLLKEIKATLLRLECIYSGFQNVIEQDLIDCYIYELNAVYLRYKVLLKTAKAMQQKRDQQKASRKFLKPSIRLRQLIKLPAMGVRKLSG